MISIRNLKGLIRKLVKINRSYGKMAVRNCFEDIKERIGTESPFIIDGGANRGTTIDEFLEQYRFPTIHAFEPIPELAKTLRHKYTENHNVTIHENALGSKSSTVDFNIVNNMVSSSVLAPTDINREYHGSNMEIKQTLSVQQVPLDEEIDAEIDILKLDLQGYELEALRGCEKLFARIKIITIEVEFVTLYEEQPLFADIDIFLRARGFYLLNLYDLYTHPDGQLTAGDAIYLNKHYF
jgi:FkbM family methyltransferase